MTHQTYPLVSLADVANNASNPLTEDIIVFDSDTPLAMESKFPLRIDALVIALCTHGHGRIGIDMREFDIHENSLIVIQPRNYIFLTEYSDDIRIMIVACAHRVLYEILPKMTEMLPLLLHHRSSPVVDINDREAYNLTEIYNMLKANLEREQTPMLRQKVKCLMQVALYEMMEIGQQASAKVSVPRNRKKEIMARFLLAVSEDFRAERQVSYYSQKLCITPKHLSAVIKEISGRTASEWIDNYVIMEAQVLLKSSDKTIQEISDQLHFANQSFFGKYFKHHTGMSPSQYRKAPQ